MKKIDIHISVELHIELLKQTYMYIDLKISMSQVTVTLNITLVQDVALKQNIRLTKAVMLVQIQQ